MYNCTYMQTQMAICVTGFSSAPYQEEGEKIRSICFRKGLRISMKSLTEITSSLVWNFGIVLRISKRCSRREH